MRTPPYPTSLVHNTTPRQTGVKHARQRCTGHSLRSIPFQMAHQKYFCCVDSNANKLPTTHFLATRIQAAQLAIHAQTVLLRERLFTLLLPDLSRPWEKNVNKMVKPSHQVLVDIVETEGFVRAAVASELKVDCVEGVPSTEPWQSLVFQRVRQTESVTADRHIITEKTVYFEVYMWHHGVGPRSS